jgi:pilus assembly protein Flp/PilA
MHSRPLVSASVKNDHLEQKENTMSIFNRFMKDESGATAIEYALIAALMGAAVVAAMTALRPNMDTAFETIGNTLKKAK